MCKRNSLLRLQYWFVFFLQTNNNGNYLVVDCWYSSAEATSSGEEGPQTP